MRKYYTRIKGGFFFVNNNFYRKYYYEQHTRSNEIYIFLCNHNINYLIISLYITFCQIYYIYSIYIYIILLNI